MVINRKSWHWKVFDFGCYLKHTFWNLDSFDVRTKYYHSINARNVDLCTYLRTIVLTPGYFALNLVPYLLLTVFLIGVPYSAGGVTALTIIYSILVAGFIFGYILCRLMKYTYERQMKKALLTDSKAEKEDTSKRGTSFLDVCMEFYFTRIKSKICTTIDVEG